MSENKSNDNKELRSDVGSEVGTTDVPGQGLHISMLQEYGPWDKCPLCYGQGRQMEGRLDRPISFTDCWFCHGRGQVKQIQPHQATPNER